MCYGKTSDCRSPLFPIPRVLCVSEGLPSIPGSAHFDSTFAPMSSDIPKSVLCNAAGKRLVSNKPVRVLHLLGTGRAGGVETFVLDLARHIDHRRIHLSVCILGAGGPVADELRTAGAAVHVLGAAGNRKLRDVLTYYRYVRSGRFDVLHANVGGRLLRYLGRLAGCRVVLAHVHGPPDHWIDELRRGDRSLGPRIDRTYARGTNHLIACSLSVSRMLTEHCPWLSSKVSVVAYGVNLDTFQPLARDSADVEKLRRETGLLQSNLVVGFVGRLVKQKGLPYLLAAGEFLVNRFPNVRFVIVGDGSLRGELERTAALMAPSHFLFLGERRDTPRLMTLFDMLVVPSEWEGMPIVNLEAMASGRPVVAFAVDGIPEQVVDGETGLLVPCRNVAALAGAIAQLLENPSQREQMGLAGRRRVEQHFDVRTMARTIESFYLALLAGRGSTG